jgi:arsenate reductase
MTQQPLRIYHNPRCSKSRSACALVAEAGLAADVVNYLDTPPTQAELLGLLGKLGLPPTGLLRRGEPTYAEVFGDREPTEAEALEALLAHPILLERPIAVRGNRALVARPPGRVRELF